MSDRCACCDLPTYSCGRATEQRQRADAARRAGELVARGWVRAIYPGHCRNCGEPFGVGALIGAEATGWSPTGWRAECCA